MRLHSIRSRSTCAHCRMATTAFIRGMMALHGCYLEPARFDGGCMKWMARYE